MNNYRFSYSEHLQRKWYVDAARNEITKRKGQGKSELAIWDSHLLAYFKYFTICTEEMAFEQLRITTSFVEFACLDMWHWTPSTILKILVPQFINDYCYS